MAAKKNWFTAAKSKSKASTATVTIFNDIGAWGITAADFHNALREIGDIDVLDIRISSDGGDVSTGFAIYNMLKRHKAWKQVTIEGLAASMASVIACAGDEVIMPENAMMMIHNPWGVFSGESEQIISFGEALQMMQDNIAGAYEARSGMSREEILAMMDRETWLNATLALEHGFADSIEPALQVAARYDVSGFHRVPKAIRTHNKEIDKMTNKTGENENTVVVKSESDIRKEVLARASNVRSMCALAGHTELADDLIAADADDAAVIAKITEAKASKEAADKLDKKNKGDSKTAEELRAQNNGRGNEGRTAAVIDTTKIYDKFNQRKR